MEQFLRKIPVPICGLALGLASLGNLLAHYSAALKIACGLLSALILLLILIKAVRFPSMIYESLQDPVVASVTGTFPMALMILSAYLIPFFGNTVPCALWAFGVFLHALLIVWFSLKFIRRLKLRNLFASYYVVYVGIGAAAITAPAYDQNRAGSFLMYFSLCAFLMLFGPITFRYIKYRKMPEPVRPVFCIYAAPANLCLVGYLSCIPERSFFAATILYTIGCVCYLAALKGFFSCRNLPFYPSYAAFTFPFIISAIATKKYADFFSESTQIFLFFSYAATVQVVIAVFLACYVLYCYIRFLFVHSSS